MNINIKLFNSEKSVDLFYLNKFELEEGFILPILYKEFILKNNGGIINKSYFEFSSEDIVFSINHFLSFKNGTDTIEYNVRLFRDEKDILSDFLLPFSYTENTGYICISTIVDREDYGQIFYWHPSNEFEEYDKYKGAYKISNSFGEFLNSLVEDHPLES